MKGYKAFDEDLKCRGFQYEIGETFEIEEKPEMCKRGFHFCKTIEDCYLFYDTGDDTRICEIEALGDIISDEEKVKYCTNKIKIVAEIIGKEKKCNTNNSSTGYFNTGDCNTGNENMGKYNTGNHNEGDFNTGLNNTGHSNTGNLNIGDYNTSDYNIGNYNTGDCNTGYYNTGHYNLGRHNTGSFNYGNYSTGLFNTEINPKIKIFDKDSDWTMDDWDRSKARIILSRMPINHIQPTSYIIMSDEEKQKYPEAKNGMVCNILIKTTNEDRQKWWDSLSEIDKKEVFNIPNFDPYIFYQCTGIKIDFSSIINAIINGESDK
jgi:uncharacterized protein (DUF2237 family)